MGLPKRVVVVAVAVAEKSPAVSASSSLVVVPSDVES